MIPAPAAPNPAAGGLEIRSAASSLRSGEIVRARVLQALGSGRWSVSVNGRQMTARSTLSLLPDQILLLRAERSAGTLFLRLESNSSILDFLHANGLSGDALTRNVVEALMRAGLPLDPAQIRRLRAILVRGSSSRSTPERARLLALAAAKRLDLGPDALQQLVNYGGDPGGGRGGRRGGNSNSAETDDLRDTADEEEIVRDAVGRSAETADHPAQLFNHAAGPHDDHWVMIPIRYQAGQKRFDASLRLCLSLETTRMRRAALVVFGERSVRWGFEWQVSHDRPTRLTLHSPHKPTARIERETGRLRERLAEFGVETIEAIADGEEFDGFSSELPMDIMKPLREEA